MSQQSKPRVYTFDEICESQDFNHDHEFVEKGTAIETLKRLRSRVAGYLASNNVFRVIDDEISKLDPTHMPDSARDRQKVVNDRNKLVESLRVDLATANALLEKALKLASHKFDCKYLGPGHECSCGFNGLRKEIEQHRGGKL